MKRRIALSTCASLIAASVAYAQMSPTEFKRQKEAAAQAEARAEAQQRTATQAREAAQRNAAQRAAAQRAVEARQAAQQQREAAAEEAELASQRQRLSSLMVRAKSGDPQAQYRLGLELSGYGSDENIYLINLIFEKNGQSLKPSDSLPWLMSAAKSGYNRAILFLAVISLRGDINIGVKKDLELARKLLSAVANSDNDQDKSLALSLLGSMEERNYRKRIRYYINAARTQKPKGKDIEPMIDGDSIHKLYDLLIKSKGLRITDSEKLSIILYYIGTEDYAYIMQTDEVKAYNGDKALRGVYGQDFEYDFDLAKLTFKKQRLNSYFSHFPRDQMNSSQKAADECISMGLANCELGRTLLSRVPEESKGFQLGMRINDVDADGKPAAIVSEIGPGSKAEASGFRQGDLITKVNDAEFASIDEVIETIRTSSGPTSLSFQVMRDGSPIIISVPVN